MPVNSAVPVFPRRLVLPMLLAALVLATAVAADASLVRPLESQGEIAGVLDVHERPGPDGRLDLVLLFALPNRELAFLEERGGRYHGRLRVKARLRQQDGREIVREEALDLRAPNLDAVESGTARQVFSLVVEDVAGPYATLDVRVDDLSATRVVSTGEAPRPPAAVFAGEWVRPVPDDEIPGLSIHPPLFTAGAPLGMLPEALGEAPPISRRILHDHVNPTRRYGLEAERLQVVFEVAADAGRPGTEKLLPRNLMMQVLAKELDLVHRDTLQVLDDPVSFLASGGRATVSWELDVQDLPPGSYQLSCAPLDGLGGSWINEFDVVWSMEALTRSRPELLLVGHLVLPDDELDRFERTGPVEQDAILTRFWQENDPDPTTRINEAEIEFRERMAHVRRNLGGFGRKQPLDDRGLVYLMLGPPDDVDRQVIPVNSESFEDAVQKVYNAYEHIHQGLFDAPVADMPTALGETTEERQAQRELRARVTSHEKVKSYELWSYNNQGRPLFANRFSGKPSGLRFLFLSRLADGSYSLEVSNAADSGI